MVNLKIRKKIKIFLYLNKTLLLKTCISTFSPSVIILSNSIIFLPGITIFISSSDASIFSALIIASKTNIDFIAVFERIVYKCDDCDFETYDVDEYNDAITNYLKASKLDEDAMTYSRISSCYEDMGDWASAIEYMDKAINNFYIKTLFITCCY